MKAWVQKAYGVEGPRSSLQWGNAASIGQYPKPGMETENPVSPEASCTEKLEGSRKIVAIGLGFRA